MTLGGFILWLLFGCLMLWLGARGGFLLWLSRMIDYARAAVACAQSCWKGYKIEWARQWPEALRWARTNR